jgi:hypothetical protein
MSYHTIQKSVWCGVSVFGIIGPHFFEEGNCTVTVTSIWHSAGLETLKIDARRCQRTHSMWINGLWESHISWPFWCDCFLSGHLKDKVCLNKPHTLEELKELIKNKIRVIEKGLLQVVMDNFQWTLQECIACKGDHLRDVLLKSKGHTLNDILLLMFCNSFVSYIQPNLSKLWDENHHIVATPCINLGTAPVLFYFHWTVSVPLMYLCSPCQCQNYVLQRAWWILLYKAQSLETDFHIWFSAPQ